MTFIVVNIKIFLLYPGIIKAGGVACASGLQPIASDRRLMTALIRVFYYSLFQKEFDFTIDFNAGKETV